VSAGPDITINEGAVATLQGAGASSYWWTPNNTLAYFNTANPDATPLTTTTYLLIGLDDNGCAGYDWVTVFVIPGKELIFYNTFTPNNDGDNDVWVIANVQQYPENKLHVYNRYGQLVFAATPYLNTWNGKNLGEDLADGTYYYTFDPGDGNGIKYGSVTIIR
jgi:gliding motility-associated-like protein